MFRLYNVIWEESKVLEHYKHTFNDEMLSRISAALDRGEDILIRTQYGRVKVLVLPQPKVIYKELPNGQIVR